MPCSGLKASGSRWQERALRVPRLHRRIKGPFWPSLHGGQMEGRSMGLRLLALRLEGVEEEEGQRRWRIATQAISARSLGLSLPRRCRSSCGHGWTPAGPPTHRCRTQLCRLSSHGYFPVKARTVGRRPLPEFSRKCSDGLGPALPQGWVVPSKPLRVQAAGLRPYSRGHGSWVLTSLWVIVPWVP